MSLKDEILNILKDAENDKEIFDVFEKLALPWRDMGDGYFCRHNVIGKSIAGPVKSIRQMEECDSSLEKQGYQVLPEDEQAPGFFQEKPGTCAQVKVWDEDFNDRLRKVCHFQLIGWGPKGAVPMFARTISGWRLGDSVVVSPWMNPDGTYARPVPEDPEEALCDIEKHYLEILVTNQVSRHTCKLRLE